MNPENWQKVKAIFYPALDLPIEKRLEFIKEKCGDDAELLAEIKALLESTEESKTFIEKPVFEVSELVVSNEKRNVIGQTIGAYKIESEIGRGGMGAVYLASRADKEFKKKVAVKLIKRGFDTDEIIKRFRNERQILAGLEHPNITRLIDGGSTDDGLPFLVMDYVEGKPLTKYADENALSINERLQIFLQICAAVSYAHQNLIIHRDLKPSNILVAGEGTPKLLDFGIAKIIAEEVADETQGNTMTRVMTPEYASPEQIQGKQITTATDVYSLGVILYELLTGERPYKMKTKSAEQLSKIITDSEPLKPSSVISSKIRIGEITHENPKSEIRNPKLLRGDLDNIILMAMRKEPTRRYSSVEQFAEDIGRYLNGLPVIAQEDTFSYRAGKFIKRNKAGVAAFSGIALSLVGGLIAASRQAKIAKKQRDRARKEAQKAEKVNQFLQKMLNSADPRFGSKDVKVIEVLGMANESIERDFANQPEIAADLHTTIGLTYLSVGQIKLAETHLQSALEIRRAVYPRKSVEVAMSLNNYGKLVQAKGNLNAAEPLYVEALETLRHLQGASLEVAEVLDNLGYLFALKGRNEDAIRLHEEEVSIRRRILGENHPDLAKSLERLGAALAVMDRRELAEPLIRQALKILQNFHRREHPDLALAMIDLAGAIYPKYPEEAETLCRESLAMRLNLFGEGHADTAWSCYNLAFVLINRKKFAEAEENIRKVLQQRGANLPAEHPVIGSCLLILGRILMAQGRFSEAEAAFLECLDLRRKTLPEDHWLIASTCSFLGECLIYLGETEKGKQMMIESSRIIKEKLGTNHEQTRQAFERLQKFDD